MTPQLTDGVCAESLLSGGRWGFYRCTLCRHPHPLVVHVAPGAARRYRKLWCARRAGCAAVVGL